MVLWNWLYKKQGRSSSIWAKILPNSKVLMSKYGRQKKVTPDPISFASKFKKNVIFHIFCRKKDFNLIRLFFLLSPYDLVWVYQFFFQFDPQIGLFSKRKLFFNSCLYGIKLIKYFSWVPYRPTEQQTYRWTESFIEEIRS